MNTTSLSLETPASPVYIDGDRLGPDLRPGMMMFQRNSKNDGPQERHPEGNIT
jgi:hypothetical protein